MFTGAKNCKLALKQARRCDDISRVCFLPYSLDKMRRAMAGNAYMDEYNEDSQSSSDEYDPKKEGRWTIYDMADSRGIQLSIQEIISTIGDDPKREGLLDTPDRVLRSWNEIYSGYTVDIGVMMTQFESEGYDEMIVLGGIEFTSICEHHMLPFHGKAWVAYIPQEKIVGVSKLSRLVDAYARRLQNQERITMQVTAALDLYLRPLGSACVLKAHHHCMGCRGVKQPHAVMTTSSLTGVFKDVSQTRLEFLTYVNGDSK